VNTNPPERKITRLQKKVNISGDYRVLLHTTMGLAKKRDSALQVSVREAWEKAEAREWEVD